MAQRRRVVDITDNFELREIVEEATATRQPVILQVSDVDVAAIEPLSLPEDETSTALEADFEEFVSTFGAWSAIDGESLKAQLRAARGSSRKHVQL